MHVWAFVCMKGYCVFLFSANLHRPLIPKSRIFRVWIVFLVRGRKHVCRRTKWLQGEKHSNIYFTLFRRCFLWNVFAEYNLAFNKIENRSRCEFKAFFGLLGGRIFFQYYGKSYPDFSRNFPDFDYLCIVARLCLLSQNPQLEQNIFLFVFFLLSVKYQY